MAGNSHTAPCSLSLHNRKSFYFYTHVVTDRFENASSNYMNVEKDRQSGELPLVLNTSPFLPFKSVNIFS